LIKRAHARSTTVNKTAHERSVEVAAIRQDLIDGENSGVPKKFNATAFKKRMQKTWLNSAPERNA
jgi:Arc/MetJ-type ribon-helix-helix transcriptional regulator